MRFFNKLFSNFSFVDALTVGLPILAVAGTVGIRAYQDNQATAAMNAMSKECPYMQCPMGEEELPECSGDQQGDWAMCEFDSATLASFDLTKGNSVDAVVSDVEVLTKKPIQRAEQIKMPPRDCIVPLIYPEPESSQGVQPILTLDSNSSPSRLFTPGQHVKTNCFNYTPIVCLSLEAIREIMEQEEGTKRQFETLLNQWSASLATKAAISYKTDTEELTIKDTVKAILDGIYLPPVDSSAPIKLYPNPANGLNGATLEGVISAYTITDAQGRIITRQTNVSSDRTQIGLGLTPGRYMLVVTLPNGKVETRTLVIGD